MMSIWSAAIMERTLQKDTPTNKPFYRRTWLVVLAITAAVFVLVLVVLPYGISYGLQQWLATNGGDDVQLEDIDFNVFTGRASVTNLDVVTDGQSHLVIPRLELDVDWLPMFSRHIDARAITRKPGVLVSNNWISSIPR